MWGLKTCLQHVGQSTYVGSQQNGDAGPLKAPQMGESQTLGLVLR